MQRDHRSRNARIVIIITSHLRKSLFHLSLIMWLQRRVCCLLRNTQVSKLKANLTLTTAKWLVSNVKVQIQREGL